MTSLEYEALAASYGYSDSEEDIVQFTNRYVRTLSAGNGGINIEVNSDFDFTTAYPDASNTILTGNSMNKIHVCTGYDRVSDTEALLKFVPANDYYNLRWFVNINYCLNSISAVFTFAKDKNLYKQAYEAKLKSEYNSGKFDGGQKVGTSAGRFSDDVTKRNYPISNET